AIVVSHLAVTRPMNPADPRVESFAGLFAVIVMVAGFFGYDRYMTWCDHASIREYAAERDVEVLNIEWDPLGMSSKWKSGLRFYSVRYRMPQGETASTFCSIRGWINCEITGFEHLSNQSRRKTLKQALA